MWRWLKHPENRAVLGWIGGGLVTLAAGGWAIFTYFDRADRLGGESPRVHVEHGVGAGGDIQAGGDIAGGDIIHGMTPKEVQEAIATFSADKIERLSGELGVTEAAVANFFRILGTQRVPLEELDATLREIANRHKTLLAALAAFRSDDPAVLAKKEEAAEAVARGAYDRAQELLRAAEQLDIAAAEQAQAVAEERLLSAAESRAGRAQVELARLRYVEAADLFREAADLVPASAPTPRARYLIEFADAAREAGDYAQEAALQEALSLYELALGLDDPHVAQALSALARLYWAQGRYDAAQPLLQRALRIEEKGLGANPPELAQFSTNRPNYSGHRGNTTRPGRCMSER